MKKFTAILLTMGMILAAIPGCGQTGNAGAATSGSSAAETGKDSQSAAIDPAQIKTLGDFYALGGEENQSAYSEEKYARVITVDGTWYRAKADLPEGLYEKLSEIEFDDPDREQKMLELLGPIEVTAFDNLTENIPTQEEMDKNIGRTGGELFEEGWSYWYYNLEDMEAGLSYGDYSYAVRFAYDGEPMVNSDDFDFYAEFENLTVESISFDGLGDATSLE